MHRPFTYGVITNLSRTKLYFFNINTQFLEYIINLWLKLFQADSSIVLCIRIVWIIINICITLDIYVCSFKQINKKSLLDTPGC